MSLKKKKNNQTTAGDDESASLEQTLTGGERDVEKANASHQAEGADILHSLKANVKTQLRKVI